MRLIEGIMSASLLLLLLPKLPGAQSQDVPVGPRPSQGGEPTVHSIATGQIAFSFHCVPLLESGTRQQK
jgi:hypothetical protein